MAELSPVSVKGHRRSFRSAGLVAIISSQFYVTAAFVSELAGGCTPRPSQFDVTSPGRERLRSIRQPLKSSPFRPNLDNLLAADSLQEISRHVQVQLGRLRLLPPFANA